MQDYDVIIVGYGPAGLVLASSLGVRGHRVAVVERQRDLYHLPRLTHIDDETARIIQTTGDVELALRDSSSIDSYIWQNGQGDVLLRVGSADLGPHGYPKDISIFQPDIEQSIHQRVVGYPNVTLLRGRQATALEQTDSEVRLTLGESKAGEAGQTIRARYLVGCDGANSFIRGALGVGRADFGFSERWLNIDGVRLRDLPPAFDSTIQFCDPARGHMHLPIGKKRLRFEFAMEAHETVEQMERPEVGWEWLRATHNLGPEDIAITRQVVYEFGARIADAWRRGRVFLAGDAAHTMPPYLGQGACSGMRDALNLAWKLDLVLRGLASDAALDSYEAERRPHVTVITQIALKLGQIANERDPEKAKARDQALKTSPPGALSLPPMNTGIVDPDRSPLAGLLLPQGKVVRAGVSGLFDDIVGPGFVFLSKDPAETLLSETQLAWLDRLGVHRVVLGASDLQDVDGVYERLLDENGLAFVISRPDFTIFGSGQNAAAADPLVDKLRRLLGELG